MSATGIFLWSVFAMLGDDYIITAEASLLPIFGLAFGPLRLIALFRLWPEWRVFAASVSCLLWWMICSSLFRTHGLIPMEGAALGLLVGDVLTVGKFSLVSWARRHAG